MATLVYDIESPESFVVIEDNVSRSERRVARILSEFDGWTSTAGLARITSIVATFDESSPRRAARARRALGTAQLVAFHVMTD